jgi:hypothetical protein
VLHGVGAQDIFVAKYDPNGMLLWAKGAGGGGPNQDFVWGIALDPAGNNYVTGWLGSGSVPANFGSGVTLDGPGAFVVKHDSGGNAVWARTLSPSGVAYAIAVDDTGNSYVGGAIQGPLPDLLPLITVWKVSANGATLWTRTATGTYGGAAVGMSVDPNGNSAATGEVQGGTATFGLGEPNRTDITSGEGGVLFVAKYDTSGNLLWARQSSPATQAGASPRGNAISTDAAGNSYLVGVGSTILGPGEPNETPVVNMFVAKYDSLGSLAWARSVAPPFGQVSWLFAIAHNSAGHTFITGTSIQGNVFIVKYASDGALLWSRRLAAASIDVLALQGNGIAVDSAGIAYVAGQFSGSVIFGPGEPNETLLMTTSGNFDFDVFLAKYLGEGTPVADDQNVNTAEDTPVAITLTASDPDGDPLTYTTTTSPAHGVLTGSAPNLTYTPNANYHGPDSFMFHASDLSLTSTDATVTIDVASVNDVPIGVNDTASTERGTAVTIAVLVNDTDADGDSLAVTAVGPASTGTVQVNVDNTVTYTPPKRFTGAATFPYTVADGNGGTSAAVVTVTVLAPNASPRASTDRATTNLNTAITIDVLANDSDPDGDALQIIAISQPVSGITVLNSNQTITYTPNASFSGRDPFTYTISDGRGGTATGQVVVTVRR